MKAIADTGLIVALLNRRDRFHSWALDAFTRFAPFFTCDAVLVESASFFPTPNPVLTLVERGDLVLDASFVLSHELPAGRVLTAKYADAPMDLADACIVRMAELSREGKVWTVDRADFFPSFPSCTWERACLRSCASCVGGDEDAPAGPDGRGSTTA